MFERLESLADLAGVETSYEDAWGRRRRLSRRRIRRLVELLGTATADGRDPRRATGNYEGRPQRRTLPAAVVIRQGEPIDIPVAAASVSADVGLRWWIETESGAKHEGTVRLGELPPIARRRIDRSRRSCRRLRLPLELPLGYHKFGIAAGIGEADAETALIIVPRKCYLPRALAKDDRTWGFAIQLYSLRSERNWGIGDFTDLLRLVEGVHALGGGVVGVSPLHASFLAAPEKASPYEPTSRSFLNILHLDVERVPEYAECRSARELVATTTFQERLAALRAAPFVDYAGVARSKLQVLERLFRCFAERHLGDSAREPLSDRGKEFRDFQRSNGAALRTHATFDALSEYFAAQGKDAAAWPEWPEMYQRPDSAAVERFIGASLERVEFYEYLQWLAADQVQAVRLRSEELGLSIGLYLDLAVGTSRNGADVWADREAYVADATVGAPPDLWNPKGQDWGLPPLHPRVLQERAYAPFADVVRANMRLAGALRIDHVLALLHLYWIPHGKSPEEGGFVRYPFDDLLGIIALESHRNRCIVVGEDLGTVPESFKERLHDAGVLSYRLLYFEQPGQGRFKPSAEYPRLALAAVTTHDLPTLAGYWAAHDLQLRGQLHLFPSPRLEREAYASRSRCSRP
jgi:(1->4)-alpha-D-glucan 1-alpha-D-glucosylmutase